MAIRLCSVGERRPRQHANQLFCMIVVVGGLVALMIAATVFASGDLSKLPATTIVRHLTSADRSCSKSPEQWNTTVLYGLPDEPALAMAKSKFSRRQRIGFATYATGPYNAFLPDMWESLKRYVLTDHDVHLFVFTDTALNGTTLSGPNVHSRHQPRLGWPFDSIGRHYLYLRYLSWFSGMDYVYSVDCDVLFTGPWDERILANRVGALNAWFFGVPVKSSTYDRRVTLSGKPFSTAFIEDGVGTHYFAGGLFGGTLDGFADILRASVALVKDDLRQSPPRIALWHDESYLNAVFAEHPPDLILGPHYIYPEPPADKWLMAAENVASKSWFELQKLGARPLMLNLGVRKHLNNQNAQFQPSSSVVPAIMSELGKPTAFWTTPDRRRLQSKVTFIIKAFERPTCLKRLIASIASHYPSVPVLIADDSRSPLLSDDEVEQYRMVLQSLQYVKVEYDIGLAAGRNMLVDFVQTPMVMLFDDDFILEGTSNLDALIGPLEWGGYDIVGGCIDSAYSYSLVREGSFFQVHPDLPCAGVATRAADYDAPELSCWRVDMINNFFMARTAFLRSVRWDPRLKMGEHEDFFLRVQLAGGRVGLCKGAQAVNDNSCDHTPFYMTQRGRVFDFWVTFFHKWSITQMATAAGKYSLMCTGNQLAVPLRKYALPDVKCTIKVEQDTIWFKS